MIRAAHTLEPHTARLLPDLARVLRTHLHPRRPADDDGGSPSVESTLVRALCHDMHGALACLENALRHLDAGPHRDSMLSLARTQAAHLTSMLRTAEATGGAPPHDAVIGQPLRDVVTASLAASGLARGQFTVRLHRRAGDVVVGDARLQRILVNLLENAHRHGAGRVVHLEVSARDGRVELALTQAGVPADRVAGYLRTEHPPPDVTGLGLWSVQRQAGELGGRVVCEDSGRSSTIRVQLPDR